LPGFATRPEYARHSTHAFVSATHTVASPAASATAVAPAFPAWLTSVVTSRESPFAAASTGERIVAASAPAPARFRALELSVADRLLGGACGRHERARRLDRDALRLALSDHRDGIRHAEMERGADRGGEILPDRRGDEREHSGAESGIFGGEHAAKLVDGVHETRDASDPEHLPL